MASIITLICVVLSIELAFHFQEDISIAMGHLQTSVYTSSPHEREELGANRGSPGYTVHQAQIQMGSNEPIRSNWVRQPQKEKQITKEMLANIMKGKSDEFITGLSNIMEMVAEVAKDELASRNPPEITAKKSSTKAIGRLPWHAKAEPCSSDSRAEINYMHHLMPVKLFGVPASAVRPSGKHWSEAHTQDEISAGQIAEGNSLPTRQLNNTVAGASQTPEGDSVHPRQLASATDPGSVFWNSSENLCTLPVRSTSNIENRPFTSGNLEQSLGLKANATEGEPMTALTPLNCSILFHNTKHRRVNVGMRKDNTVDSARSIFVATSVVSECLLSLNLTEDSHKPYSGTLPDHLLEAIELLHTGIYKGPRKPDIGEFVIVLSAIINIYVFLLYTVYITSYRGHIAITGGAVAVRLQLKINQQHLNDHDYRQRQQPANQQPSWILYYLRERAEGRRQIFTGRINIFVLTLFVVTCCLPYAAAQAEKTNQQLGYSRMGGALLMLAVTCMFGFRSSYWSQHKRASEPPPYEAATRDRHFVSSLSVNQKKRINTKLKLMGIDPATVPNAVKYAEPYPRVAYPDISHHPEDYPELPQRSEPLEIPTVSQPIPMQYPPEASSYPTYKYEEQMLSMQRDLQREIEETRQQLEYMQEDRQRRIQRTAGRTPPRVGRGLASKNQIRIDNIKYRMLNPGEEVRSRDERYLKVVGGYNYIVVNKERDDFDFQHGYDVERVRYSPTRDNYLDTEYQRDQYDRTDNASLYTHFATQDDFVPYTSQEEQEDYEEEEDEEITPSVYSKTDRITEATSKPYIGFATKVRREVDTLTDEEFATCLHSRVPMYYREDNGSGTRVTKKITAVTLLIPSAVSDEEKDEPRTISVSKLERSFTAAEYISYRRKHGDDEDSEMVWTPRNTFHPFGAHSELMPATRFVEEEYCIDHPAYPAFDIAVEQSEERRKVHKFNTKSRLLAKASGADDDDPARFEIPELRKETKDLSHELGETVEKKFWPLIQVGLVVKWILTTYLKFYKQYKKGMPVKMTPHVALCHYIMALVWNFVYHRPSIYRRASGPLKRVLERSYGLVVSRTHMGGTRMDETFPFVDWEVERLKSEKQLREKREKEERELAELDAAIDSDGEPVEERFVLAKHTPPKRPIFSTLRTPSAEDGDDEGQGDVAGTLSPDYSVQLSDDELEKDGVLTGALHAHLDDVDHGAAILKADKDQEEFERVINLHDQEGASAHADSPDKEREDLSREDLEAIFDKNAEANYERLAREADLKAKDRMALHTREGLKKARSHLEEDSRSKALTPEEVAAYLDKIDRAHQERLKRQAEDELNAEIARLQISDPNFVPTDGPLQHTEEEREEAEALLQELEREVAKRAKEYQMSPEEARAQYKAELDQIRGEYQKTGVTSQNDLEAPRKSGIDPLAARFTSMYVEQMPHAGDDDDDTHSAVSGQTGAQVRQELDKFLAENDATEL